MAAAMTPAAFYALMRYAGITYLTTEALDLVYRRVLAYLSSPEALEHILGGINNLTERYGLTLTALNPDAIRQDLDKFVTLKMNENLGTEFETLDGLGREEVLTEVGRVLAVRVNAASGSHIDNLYPPEDLPNKIGAELIRQLETGEDGFIPEATIQEVHRVVMEDLPGYVPPVLPADAGKAAKSRARQKKYRRTHKQIWINR